MRIIILLLLLVVPSFASTLSVGVGATQEQAINRALKTAVEMTVGSFIVAETEVINKVIQEKVLSYSQGYVKDYKVVKSSYSKESKLYRVVVDATVDAVKLSNIAVEYSLQDKESIEIAKDQISDLQKRIQKRKEIIGMIKDYYGHTWAEHFVKFYDVKLIGYYLSDVTTQQVKGHYEFTITVNQARWVTLLNMIESLNSSYDKGMTKYLSKDQLDSFGFPSFSQVPSDLVNHLFLNFKELYIGVGSDSLPVHYRRIGIKANTFIVGWSKKGFNGSDDLVTVLMAEFTDSQMPILYTDGRAGIIGRMIHCTIPFEIEIPESDLTASTLNDLKDISNLEFTIKEADPGFSFFKVKDEFDYRTNKKKPSDPLETLGGVLGAILVVASLL